MPDGDSFKRNEANRSSEKEIICSPHIINVSIPSIDNEFFVLQLDAKGVAVSTKSSCLRDEKESYVLKSIGANSNASVRFSFGRFTKVGDIKKSLKIINEVLKVKGSNIKPNK